MIETEQVVAIQAPIERVWDYVRSIEGWASLMPGFQQCEVIDDNDSRWTLKVGAGGLLRTVNVHVHVDEWDGPERVTFSYRLAGDPVQGGGLYMARVLGSAETEVSLRVRVEGSGPMAPMWEAMGKPLLPKFAKAFADELKARIEAIAGTSAPVQAVRADKPSLLAFLFGKLRAFWRRATGSDRHTSPN